ncbi:hypothetical protein [Jatrophihabitans endophyticus]|uniref:hypothetical protein n=1 Tax=Jatrophihabitans endophyticus TaxID=1206085 RepID=UPI001161086A|nr:hypothetical protein [Jatrophihabitans endophyticus]
MDDERALPAPRWRVRTDRRRPRRKRLSAQLIARVDVYSPQGELYYVNVVRNAPLAGAGELAMGSDLGSVAQYLGRNLEAWGDTGWKITVDAPATSFRSARTLFVMPVSAKAILIEVTEVVVAAVARGDCLWPDD